MSESPADIEQPSAATAERLGRAAASALAELLGSSLARTAAVALTADGGGADDAATQNKTDPAGPPAPPGARNRHGESTTRQDATPFALDAVVAGEALLNAVDGYPEWFEQHVRDGLLDRLGGLLEVDPNRDDPVLPQGEHQSAMQMLRFAVVIEALVALGDWTPREDDLDKAQRATLEELRPSVRDRLEALVVALADLVVADPTSRPHTFISFRVMRALRRAQERLGGQDEAEDTAADGKEPPAAETPGITSAKAETKSAVTASDGGGAEKDDAATGTSGSDAATSQDKRGGGDAGAVAAGAASPADRIEEAVSTVWSGLKKELEGKLARHQLGLVSSGEIVALAFGGAAAAVQGPFAARHADAAIRASLDVPDVATGWAEGRVVAVESKGAFRRSLPVPAPEVFSAVAEALLVSMADSDLSLDAAQHVHAALGRGLEVLDNTFLEPPAGEGQPGWADELFGDQSTSLWSTAAALRLSVVSSDVASRRAREGVFARYDTVRTSGRNWPKFLKWGDYWRSNEPDCKALILRYIQEEIVEPRRKAGPSSRTDPAVALLFGPPGTTKTTIARGVGNGLGWPVVNLSPANFLDEGLDAVERRARLVFADLHALSRAVVILDEADELFRKRRPVPETEAMRGVTAFMTASMLPRLQDLHDRGRIVLFICTNFLSSIDGAMRRVGRVDHLIAVPPPDEKQRGEMIRRELSDELAADVKFLPEAIDTLAHHTSKFIRGELLPAAGDIVSRATERGGFANADAAKAAAKEVADQRRKTITIPGRDKEDEVAWEQFLNDLKVLSAPHIKAGESSWPEARAT